MKTADASNSALTGKVEFFKPDALPSRRQPTDFDLAYKWLRGTLPFKKDADYLALVRKYPCIVCGAPAPSEVHHVASGYHGGKTTDYLTVPLCNRHHAQTETDHNFMVEMLKYYVAFSVRLKMDERAK